MSPLSRSLACCVLAFLVPLHAPAQEPVAPEPVPVPAPVPEAAPDAPPPSTAPPAPDLPPGAQDLEDPQAPAAAPDVRPAAVVATEPPPPLVPRASDWATTGDDCSVFAAGDVDGDGFADVLTRNGRGELCVAASVLGFKASPWRVLAENVPDDVQAIVAADLRPDVPGIEVALVRGDRADVHARYEGGRFTETTSLPLPLPTTSPAAPAFPDDPPPFEPEAPVLARFSGDVNGDGLSDLLVVHDCAKPHRHRVVRVALAPNAASGDLDADGLLDADEGTLGTDPLDRDTDDDGLLDGFEVHGFPRAIDLGARVRYCGVPAPEPLPDDTLSPRRQDVVCSLSYFEGVDPAAMDVELERVARLYRGLSNENPDGSRGVRLHFRVEPSFVPKDAQQRPWHELGAERLASHERGLLHWMQVTPWGGGQAQQTGDMGGSGNGFAVFAHEFAHQLSLSHEGDSEAAWCPLYPSLMNYAFSYALGGDPAAIRFSDGRFRGVELVESRLAERLPFPYAELKYLESHPFRFTLEDDGQGGTRIDWNHDGRFDEGTVAADVNYGGSTHAGLRRDVAPIGSQPTLVAVGGAIHLVASTQTQDHVWIRAEGPDESWGEPRAIPNSGGPHDPVAVGGERHGLVFHRHLFGWRVTRFDAATLDGPHDVRDLPQAALSAARVNDRVLLVSRLEDDTLEARWFTFTDRPVLSPPQRLETRSQVAPGVALDPADGSLVMATAMPNSKGVPYAMRVTKLRVAGDRLIEETTTWTRGETGGNQCCTRPVVAFTEAGQLTIFHTGAPDPAGQMIAYRTQRVGNVALDEGWLTCMLYDVWTRTRVGVGFVAAAGKAIYAYRWDAGGERVNGLQTAHRGFGIDEAPMRDFDDGEKIAKWGIRHSILWMRP